MSDGFFTITALDETRFDVPSDSESSEFYQESLSAVNFYRHEKLLGNLQTVLELTLHDFFLRCHSKCIFETRLYISANEKRPRTCMFGCAIRRNS